MGLITAITLQMIAGVCASRQNHSVTSQLIAWSLKLMSSRRRYAPHSFCTNEGPEMMSVIMGLAVKSNMGSVLMSFMGSVMKLVMVSVISSLESLFVSKF